VGTILSRTHKAAPAGETDADLLRRFNGGGAVATGAVFGPRAGSPADSG
jgi:hypothetical protein